MGLRLGASGDSLLGHSQLVCRLSPAHTIRSWLSYCNLPFEEPVVRLMLLCSQRHNTRLSTESLISRSLYAGSFWHNSHDPGQQLFFPHRDALLLH